MITLSKELIGRQIKIGFVALVKNKVL